MLTGAASYSWIISTVTHGAGGCYIPDMKVAWFVVAVTASLTVVAPPVDGRGGGP